MVDWNSTSIECVFIRFVLIRIWCDEDSQGTMKTTNSTNGKYETGEQQQQPPIKWINLIADAREKHEIIIFTNINGQ